MVTPAVALPQGTPLRPAGSKGWDFRLMLSFLICLVLLECAFRFSGAHRFRYWLEYGYGVEQGLRDLGQGRLAMYSSANRRFWPRNIQAKPDPGVRRIVVVGDSVARGSSRENNWPHFAEIALNQAGCKAEVLNLSSGGYGSARKKVLTEMALARLQPQWLVYQAGITTEYEDELDRLRRDIAAAQPWRVERFSWAALWLKERKFDIIYSRWLTPRLRETDGSALAAPAIAAKTDIGAWIAQVSRNSQQILELTRVSSVGMVMAPRLSLDRSTGKLDDMGLTGLAHQLVGLDRNFDLRRHLGDRDPLPLFADRAHFTRMGNEWVGAEFARWWMAQGLCH